MHREKRNRFASHTHMGNIKIICSKQTMSATSLGFISSTAKFQQPDIETVTLERVKSVTIREHCTARDYYSYLSHSSVLSVLSYGSLLSLISALSAVSGLSLLCTTSFASAMSANSILSVLSVNSILSIGCANSSMKVCFYGACSASKR